MPLRGHNHPRRQWRTDGPERHSRTGPHGHRGRLPETRDCGEPDVKAKEGLHPQVETLCPGTAPGILCPTSSTILTPLIDVYYLSHAFPRQMNHQQRKPTRPPTTTTAATEMPAIAPVERLVLLLAATHAEEPALGVKPALHVQTCFP